MPQHLDHVLALAEYLVVREIRWGRRTSPAAFRGRLSPAPLAATVIGLWSVAGELFLCRVSAAVVWTCSETRFGDWSSAADG